MFQNPNESKKCYFTISLKGNSLMFTTPKGDCSAQFCGVRGNLNGNYFTVKDKVKKSSVTYPENLHFRTQIGRGL